MQNPDDTTPAAPEPEPTAEDKPARRLPPIPVFATEPSDKPRYCVIGDELVGQTAHGEIRITLRVPFRLIAYIEDLSPRDQLYIVLRDRGEPSAWRRFLGWKKGRDVVRRIENLDAVDSWELVRKFWQAYGEKEQVRLGESWRSADTSQPTEER